MAAELGHQAGLGLEGSQGLGIDTVVQHLDGDVASEAFLVVVKHICETAAAQPFPEGVAGELWGRSALRHVRESVPR
jgi:hypothetical protein